MADVAVRMAPERTETVSSWSFLHRVAFRFACCYWLLYAMPDSGRVSIFSAFPGGEFVFTPYAKLWHAIVPWVAIHVFGVTGRAATYFPTGSGDTTLDYILNLLFVVIAAAATLLWTVLDRPRRDYRALDGWLRLLVRYTLAFTLFAYGFAKVFPLQFQPARFGRLIEPYGEFSPMGVLWSFMGASTAYTIFAGAAEATGGLLLLFRRTTTLGAMVSFGVLFNVALLNYCYDVPVKLYSTNLVLMALFLLAADFRRLANIFVLNRPAPAAPVVEPQFQNPKLRIAALAFCVLFVGYNLYDNISGGWKTYREYYVAPERPPLYGLYDVESGPPGWRKLYVSFAESMAVRTVDDKLLTFASQYSKGSVLLNKQDRLTWSRPDAGHVVLQGSLNGAPANIRLRKIDTNKFLLVNRGFHWINEMPFNR